MERRTSTFLACLHGTWDWPSYGPGYERLYPDYAWYPSWDRWGQNDSRSLWEAFNQIPGPIILNKDAILDVDGSFELEVDTKSVEIEKESGDFRYTVTAEVTDSSRRTIAAAGDVYVAQHPLTVVVDADRGYYEQGQSLGLKMQATSPLGSGVVAQGHLRLLAVTYDADGKPQEREVAQRKVQTATDGHADFNFRAPEPGQYRLSCELQDTQGHSAEGGELMVVRGPGFDGRACHFNGIELIPERKHYAPNEELRLLINTDAPDSYVILFDRAADGIVKEPRFIHLAGKSAVIKLRIAKEDVPNRFLEAFTISHGKVESVMREIFVPPQSRILNLTAIAEPKAKPRDHTRIQLKLMDEDGRPYSGEVVLTMYDKALEYISHGSNVPLIREIFWGWKRSHSVVEPQWLREDLENLVPLGTSTDGVIRFRLASTLSSGGFFVSWAGPVRGISVWGPLCMRTVNGSIRGLLYVMAETTRPRLSLHHRLRPGSRISIRRTALYPWSELNSRTPRIGRPR